MAVMTNLMYHKIMFQEMYSSYAVHDHLSLGSDIENAHSWGGG